MRHTASSAARTAVGAGSATGRPPRTALWGADPAPPQQRGRLGAPAWQSAGGVLSQPHDPAWEAGRDPRDADSHAYGRAPHAGGPVLPPQLPPRGGRAAALHGSAAQTHTNGRAGSAERGAGSAERGTRAGSVGRDAWGAGRAPQGTGPPPSGRDAPRGRAWDDSFGAAGARTRGSSGGPPGSRGSSADARSSGAPRDAFAARQADEYLRRVAGAARAQPRPRPRSPRGTHASRLFAPTATSAARSVPGARGQQTRAAQRAAVRPGGAAAAPMNHSAPNESALVAALLARVRSLEQQQQQQQHAYTQLGPTSAPHVDISTAWHPDASADAWRGHAPTDAPRATALVERLSDPASTAAAAARVAAGALEAPYGAFALAPQAGGAAPSGATNASDSVGNATSQRAPARAQHAVVPHADAAAVLQRDHAGDTAGDAWRTAVPNGAGRRFARTDVSHTARYPDVNEISRISSVGSGRSGSARAQRGARTASATFTPPRARARGGADGPSLLVSDTTQSPRGSPHTVPAMGDAYAADPLPGAAAAAAAAVAAAARWHSPPSPEAAAAALRAAAAAAEAAYADAMRRAGVADARSNTATPPRPARAAATPPRTSPRQRREQGAAADRSGSSAAAVVPQPPPFPSMLSPSRAAARARVAAKSAGADPPAVAAAAAAAEATARARAEAAATAAAAAVATVSAAPLPPHHVPRGGVAVPAVPASAQDGATSARSFVQHVRELMERELARRVAVTGGSSPTPPSAHDHDAPSSTAAGTAAAARAVAAVRAAHNAIAHARADHASTPPTDSRASPSPMVARNDDEDPPGRDRAADAYHSTSTADDRHHFGDDDDVYVDEGDDDAYLRDAAGPVDAFTFPVDATNARGSPAATRPYGDGDDRSPAASTSSSGSVYPQPLDPASAAASRRASLRERVEGIVDHYRATGEVADV